MNFRHATALALVGWYLIVPPPIPNKIVDFFTGTYIPTGFATHASLSTWWRVDHAFESVAACDQARTVHINEMKILSKTHPSQTHDKMAEQMLASKCVATDDPRLRGN